MDVGIICLSKTHLRNSQNLNLKGYLTFTQNRNFLHKDAPTASGGVTVLIRDELLQGYKVTATLKNSGYPSCG